MKIQEIRDLTPEQHAEALRAAHEEIMRLRFQQTTGELKDTSRMKFLRKDIARLKTIQRQQALAGEKEGK